MPQNNQKVVVFELFGERALWQLPSEALARWSAALPAPSALAGILGASLGFRQSGRPAKSGGWETSQDWLSWIAAACPEVAVALMTPVKRQSMNTNGLKTPAELPASSGGTSTLRILQTFLEEPSYKVAVRLDKGEAELISALKNPKFPIYLGNTHCCGKILNPRVVLAGDSSAETHAPWALWSASLPDAEYNWCSRMDISGGQRLKNDGYIHLPPDSTAGLLEEKHWLKTWAE